MTFSGICNHQIVPLKTVTDEMGERLRELSQGIYEKIARCRTVEKLSWRRLAELEEHTEAVHNKIDQIAGEMVGPNTKYSIYFQTTVTFQKNCRNHQKMTKTVTSSGNEINVTTS